MPDNIVDDRVLEDAHVEEVFDNIGKGNDAATIAASIDPLPTDDKGKKDDSEEVSYTQWALGGNGRFTPVGASTPKLVAGIYEPFATPGSWGLERLNVSSDEIYELPDMATNMVLDEAERFWNNEARYRKHNLLYKRGVLLHGPPGSGKTVTIKLLMNKLVSKGGIVIIVRNVGLSAMCLKAVKRIEPTRNLICIYEDIDEIIASNGESTLLSMLDGEHNVDRVMNIASTNYPERLGARIANRPSRFDRRVYVGMPLPPAREQYLKHATGGALDQLDLDRWVKDTEGMSIAHLRELVAAVYCLEQNYTEVITRLKDMAIQVKPEQEFRNRGGLGFAGAKVARNYD